MHHIGTRHRIVQVVVAAVDTKGHAETGDIALTGRQTLLPSIDLERGGEKLPLGIHAHAGIDIGTTDHQCLAGAGIGCYFLSESRGEGFVAYKGISVILLQSENRSTAS